MGIGRAALAEGLAQGRSGVRPIASFDPSGLPVRIAGEVPEFDPKPFVRQRKSLKLMARDAMLAVAAAELARVDAGLTAPAVDPERLGVLIGADPIRNEIAEICESYRVARDEAGAFQMRLFATRGLEAGFPLGFLKALPNMLSSHVSIAEDAQGPSNCLYLRDLSSLASLGEATRLIQAGRADMILAGGASSRLHPLDWTRACLCDELSRENDEPARAVRPFDARRSGTVRGEGAAVFVLETLAGAKSRGARIYGRVAGWASAADGRQPEALPAQAALGRAIDRALAEAKIAPRDVGYVNAHGLGSRRLDQAEAAALSQHLPETPVTALKSYFGNLGAAGGAIELAASLVSLAEGRVPLTLNHEEPDPACPVRVVTATRPCHAAPVVVKVNFTPLGQAAALVVTGE